MELKAILKGNDPCHISRIRLVELIIKKHEIYSEDYRRGIEKYRKGELNQITTPTHPLEESQVEK